MELDAFLAGVGDRADLASDAAVETAIDATLVTLSERLPDHEARDLAEQLPHEIGASLTAADDRESFGYDEFVTRIAEREDAEPDREAAERHARAVFAVLLDAVQSTETDDLLTYLSPDYEPLLAGVDPEAVWGPGWRERLGQQG